MPTHGPQVVLRPATAADVGLLSGLALRSKGYWGYDAAFLDACRDELTVTVDRLATERVTVADAPATGVVGFSSLALTPPTSELLDLFVDPAHIGTGVGVLLWSDVLAAAAGAGAAWMDIEADPHAAAWYERRGAVRIGAAPSGSIAGRALPVMRVSTIRGGGPVC